MIKDILISMRPRQWTKNLIIFLALLFSINEYWQLSDLPALLHVSFLALSAFLLFCLLSGCVYLINDLVDIEQDREHPTKRRRPLASGRLKQGQAAAAIALLLLVSLPLSFLLNPAFGAVALVYFATMLAYSHWLKHVVLVDVLVIAIGFVLRAVSGAVVIAVPISPWLYVCTILLALFLALGKRRHEILLLEGDATRHRQILQEYSPEFLEQMIVLVGASTVMAYSLYTFSAPNVPSNYAMMLTIPFVLYGIFRYMYLIHIKNEGGSPEELLIKDRPLVLDVILWLLSSAVILVLFRGS
jgi:4-hydroxybenzoate polyprenyltransferase